VQAGPARRQAAPSSAAVRSVRNLRLCSSVPSAAGGHLPYCIPLPDSLDGGTWLLPPAPFPHPLTHLRTKPCQHLVQGLHVGSQRVVGMHPTCSHHTQGRRGALEAGRRGGAVGCAAWVSVSRGRRQLAPARQTETVAPRPYGDVAPLTILLQGVGPGGGAVGRADLGHVCLHQLHIRGAQVGSGRWPPVAGSACASGGGVQGNCGQGLKSCRSRAFSCCPAGNRKGNRQHKSSARYLQQGQCGRRVLGAAGCRCIVLEALADFFREAKMSEKQLVGRLLRAAGGPASRASWRCMEAAGPQAGPQAPHSVRYPRVRSPKGWVLSGEHPHQPYPRWGRGLAASKVAGRDATCVPPAPLPATQGPAPCCPLVANCLSYRVWGGCLPGLPWGHWGLCTG